MCIEKAKKYSQRAETHRSKSSDPSSTQQHRRDASRPDFWFLSSSMQRFLCCSPRKTREALRGGGKRESDVGGGGMGWGLGE